MSKRKNREYKFGGHSIEKLEERIAKCKSKIADPGDPDDKNWLARWLRAAERRLLDKGRNLDAKRANRERNQHG
jgi:hypothetical protein